MSPPHIELKQCITLNPFTMLPHSADGTPHDCLEAAEQVYKPRPDLKDTPLELGTTVFVDGSAKKVSFGQTQVGYAVVTASEVLKAKKLPSNYSAQAAELVALTEACKLFQDREVTIYTDSQYAYATVRVFCQQ